MGILEALAVFVGMWAALVVATLPFALAWDRSRRSARAGRILVTLQAMEQMDPQGVDDDPDYARLSAEYAALNRHLA